jgi:hypothetical protein
MMNDDMMLNENARDEEGWNGDDDDEDDEDDEDEGERRRRRNFDEMESSDELALQRG